jgi:hypothetical protein
MNIGLGLIHVSSLGIPACRGPAMLQTRALKDCIRTYTHSRGQRPHMPNGPLPSSPTGIRAHKPSTRAWILFRGGPSRYAFVVSHPHPLSLNIGMAIAAVVIDPGPCPRCESYSNADRERGQNGIAFVQTKPRCYNVTCPSPPVASTHCAVGSCQTAERTEKRAQAPV